MRYALTSSALVHAAIFGVALSGFAWPQPEDATAAGAVTVDIVTTHTVSDNRHAALQSSAAEHLVSSGNQAVQGAHVLPMRNEALAQTSHIQVAAPSQRLAPIQPANTQKEAAVAISPRPATEATPILIASSQRAHAKEVVALTSAERPQVAAIDAIATSVLEQALEPVAVQDFKVAPVPQTLSFKRPSQPTQRQPVKPQTTAALAAGNGGTNAADTSAGKASAGQQGEGAGGPADIAPWEHQVRRAIARAQRYPRDAKGATGDVVVRFTVSAGGALVGATVIGSSGDAVLDQAALDTINRAAPFAPLPKGSGLSSKVVQLPLGFVRN